MKKKTVVIVNFNQNSPGIGCIVKEFKRILILRGYKVFLINSLSNLNLNGNTIIIPYGPKEAYFLLKNGYHCELSLMVDYYSMGLKNRALFYLKHGKLFYKEFWRSLLGYLLYYYRENYIFSRINNFMFVSKYDMFFIQKRFPYNTYIFCPNGVNLPILKNPKSKIQNRLNLGILSHWNNLTLSECQWFIEDIMPKIIKRYQHIKLIIAGRGASEEIINYFNSISYIEFIGEVENLDSFYDKIDIYVATVPKACGILNKVLDSFAYKKFVIGTSASFTGFLDMDNCYMTCDTVDDYFNAIELFLNDKSKINVIINNAYNYVKCNNDWDTNYNHFLDELEQLSILY